MPSSQSSDPLLGSSGSDDGQWTPTEGSHGSRHDGQDDYNDVTDHQETETSGADRESFPYMGSSFSAERSNAHWYSDTESIHSERNPLMRGYTPPPVYEIADPTDTKRHAAAREESSSIPGPASNDPSKSLINFDIEPQSGDQSFNPFSKGGAPDEQSEAYQKRCEKSRKQLRILTVLALLLFASSAIFWATFSWASACRIKKSAFRDYQIQKLDHFDLSNTNSQNSGLPKGFSGIVHVLSGPSDQAVDLNVSIRSTASDLRGGKSGADWRPTKLVSCAEASLYFRPGLEISTFRIESNALNIVLSSDLVVTDTTTISIKRGNLVSKNFDSSRQTYIDVRSSSISGTFGLRDVLSIKSRSRSMSIDIVPKPVLSGPPRPAVLEIESRSGAVDIQYPAGKEAIPDREYRTTLNSRSGSVKSRILHGKETTINVRSGSLDAQILPYIFDNDSSSLTTKLQSGYSRIEVLKPYNQDGKRQTKISSLHSAKSGKLQLRYADEWQGSIYGEAQSGSLSFSGKDVEITSEGKNRGKKFVQAQKGHGHNKLKFSIQSGSADVVMGQ